MKNQMVKVITMLIVISVLLVLVACGQSNNKSVNSSVNSPKDNNQSESSTEQSPEQSVKEVENTKDASGDIKWSKSLLSTAAAFFSVKVPEGWIYSNNGTIGYSFKQGEEDIYRILINGYSSFFGPVPESLTLEQLPEFLGERITKDSSSVSSIFGELEQKIDEEQIVNVNGLEMLKVSGDILTLEMGENTSVSYYGYFAFYTNQDNKYDKVENVPIYLIMLVNSEDEEKIKYGEKVLDAVVGTLEKYVN